MNRIAFVAAVCSQLILCACRASAQPAELSAQKAFISVHSATDSVTVLVDSINAGITPLDSVPLNPGVHVIRYIPRKQLRWPAAVVSETLRVEPGIVLERNIRFPLAYMITSDPPGALVHLNGEVIGTTPMYTSSATELQMLTLSKEGYEEGEVLLPAGGGGVFSTLHRAEGAETSPLMISSEESKSLNPIIIASGATIIAGGSAAYFKLKADEKYNDYLMSGNSQLLDHVHTLDTFSAVSLALTQVGVMTICYFLLSH